MIIITMLTIAIKINRRFRVKIMKNMKWIRYMQHGKRA